VDERLVNRHSFRPVLAISLAAAIALVAMFAGTLVRFPPRSFFPATFVTHSGMLVFSVAAMWLVSKGRLGPYGFTKGTYEYGPRILLWALPTSVLSVLAAFAPPGGPGGRVAGELTKSQIVVFVWVYATICEEMLTRGLLQTLLSAGRGAQVSAATCRRLSMPVLVSGLFFGAMHLGLLQLIGPAAIPIVVAASLLGLVAARYREKTGSLFPAIIIHALFNVGGMAPLWAIQWLRR
jgi:membrane protease YdiL (CAAX protease family)